MGGAQKEKRRKWSEMGGATETEQRHSIEIDFCFFGHSDIRPSPAKYR